MTAGAWIGADATAVDDALRAWLLRPGGERRLSNRSLGGSVRSNGSPGPKNRGAGSQEGRKQGRMRLAWLDGGSALVHRPLALAAVVGLGGFAITLALSYPLAYRDWDRERTNIAEISRFFDDPVVRPLIDRHEIQQPSQFVSVELWTVVFDPEDPAGSCRSRLVERGLVVRPSALERICVDRQQVTGSLGPPGRIVSAVPVSGQDGVIQAAELQVTGTAPAPGLFAALRDPGWLLAAAMITALASMVGYLLARSAGRRFAVAAALARNDGLTGFVRREVFLAEADGQLEHARRHQRPLSVLMIDVDRLKQINDRHGHAVGDTALALIATSIRGALRAGDVAGRTGGDEFAVVLPDTAEAQAREVAGRVRAAVATVQLLTGSAPLPLSVSIGVAQASVDVDADITRLLERADARLYDMKGRDQGSVGQGR